MSAAPGAVPYVRGSPRPPGNYPSRSWFWSGPCRICVWVLALNQGFSAMALLTWELDLAQSGAMLGIYQATSLVPLARDAHPPSQDNRKSAGIALAENHWSEHFQTTPFPDQVSRRTVPRVSLGRFHCSVYAIGPCFSSRRNCVEFCTRPSVQVPDKLQTSPICQVWRDCLIKTLSSQEQ